MSKFTPPSSSAPMRPPIHLVLASFRNGLKPDDLPQDVDKSHLCVSTNTTTNLNDICSQDTSCDHLPHLDSPNHSSELQGNSIVGSTEPESVPGSEDLFQLDSASVSSQDTFSSEIKSLPEFERQLDHAKNSPTDVFLEHHDYEQFLLQKEIDIPCDNLSHQNTHINEEQNQDDILIHTTILSQTFALPKLMAQHNCEDLNPTDTPSTVPTAFQAPNNHSFNPRCAHNPMATQCNQSQYRNPIHNFAIPQLMAQPNCEDLEPTDTPSTVPTTLLASRNHTFNSKCAHNQMATQCNQPQYLTSLNKFCLKTHLQVRTTMSASPTLWHPHTHWVLGSRF